jgi:oligosaccharide 4-alpha-D-glucosyltransferase
MKILMMNRMLAALFLAVCISSSALAERKFIQAELKNHRLHILLSDSALTITPINEGTVEVFYEPNGRKQLPSFALPAEHEIYSKAELSSTELGYELILPDLKITVSTHPFELSFSNASGFLAKEEVGMFSYETIRGFRFTLAENEAMLGGGQRVLGMDRRGHRMPLYNKAHYGYSTESNQMYYSLPAVMSNKPYVIAFDNSANGFLDIGHTEKDILQFEAEAGRTSYIFSAGKNHYELLENFVSATGKQPLPPRWALGNYASRFGYKSQAEVLSTIEKFEQQDFPVDAVVIDLYWFGAEIKGHMGNLEWDNKHWPKPEEMIKTLSDNGVNTIMITEPFILSSSSQWKSAVSNKALATNLAGKPRKFDFYFGNTGLVDVFNENAQDWFWQYYQTLNDQGVSGWWGDLGEPEVHPSDVIHQFGQQQVTAAEIHNVYGHKWAEMVYDKQREAAPNRRPFIMMRSGFLGSQRYGMIPWTGDVARSWGGLKPQVELALQMGMFGLAYIHSDLGGFAGGDKFDAELYTRWLQYGVFQAVYRPHAQDHIAPEPVFHDDNTQNIVRKYIKLRYRLLPYNYSLSINNSLTGIPMMRPLFLDYPSESIERTDAYLWGDAFLIAPVVDQGQTQKEVQLPSGVWFDYWKNTRILGGKKHVFATPLDTLPTLVKAGAFIPSVSDIPNTKNYSSKSLRVDYYADVSASTSSYTLFEDDGKDPNSIVNENIQSLIFTSEHTLVGGKEHLNVVAKVSGQYQGAPKKRSITMSIHGLNKQPSNIMVDGKRVLVTTNRLVFEKGEGAYFDPLTKETIVSGILVKELSINIH